MASVQNNIGLNVIDATTSLSPVIQPANTTNIGFQIQSNRGVIDKVVRVTTYAEAIKHFGQPNADHSGLLVLRELFDNAAPFGCNVYLSRVGSGGTAANTTTRTGSTKFVLKSSSVVVTATVSFVAGSLPNTVTCNISGTLDGNAVSEQYADLKLEDIGPAINDGAGTFSPSQLVRVSFVGGSLTPLTGSIAVNASTGATFQGAVFATVTAAQFGDSDPGSWGNDVGFEIIVDENDPYRRVVIPYLYIRGEAVRQDNAVSSVTVDNQKDKLDDESYFVKMAVAASGGLLDPTNGIVRLANGADITAPTYANYKGVVSSNTGIYAFADTELAAIAYVEDNLSDADKLSLAGDLDDFCAVYRPQAIALIALNKSSNTAVENTGWNSLLKSKSFLVTYLGYIKVTDSTGSVRTISPVGSVYGAYYIRKMFITPANEGGGLPVVPPAGNQVTMVGVRGVTTPALSNTQLNYLVKTLGINPIQFIEGIGYIARTSRLMSTTNLHYDIHKRRTLNFIAASFKQSLTFLEQAPHNDNTYKKLNVAISDFLNGMYNQGAFNTLGGTQGAYRVKVDEENNPPAQQAQRILVCEVTVWVVNTIETANIYLRNTENEISVELDSSNN